MSQGLGPRFTVHSPLKIQVQICFESECVRSTDPFPETRLEVRNTDDESHKERVLVPVKFQFTKVLIIKINKGP